jgi:hypothetical protein
MQTEVAPTFERAGEEALAENEVVVVVPPGIDAKVAEIDSEDAEAQVTVRVSREIRRGVVPAVGVIVK